MTRRRGLTLLEIFAGTVMLAVLAAACVPVIASSLRALGTTEQRFNEGEPFEADLDRLDLAEIVDEFLKNPLAFGFKSVDDGIAGDPATLAWPAMTSPGARDSAMNADPRLPGVTVHVIHMDDSEAGHEWLAFQCAGHVVHRWHKLPTKPNGDQR